MPPPLGFTRAGSAPVSLIHASTTGAKASLISTTSMSSIVSPVLSRAHAVAGIGADSIITGSSPRTVMLWMRARGFRPYFFTASAEASRPAEAPSQICEATAAVSEPPSASTGSEAIFSSVVSRVVSSASRPASGTYSPAKRPSAIAARARLWDCSAHSSISRREMSHLSAIIWAPLNWEISCVPKRSVQPVDPENGSSKPYSRPASIADEMGRALMFCTPPNRITSWVPDMTAWAPKWMACWLEPHWRSTVVPGTPSGMPAASQAERAMLPAWGPMVSTQPKITSSTTSGSMPVRSTTDVMTWAPRSAGCWPARLPPRLPTGVRTASIT